MDGLMVPGRRHTTTLASRDHGGTGPSSAGPSLEPQTGPPLRGAPIIEGFPNRMSDIEQPGCRQSDGAASGCLQGAGGGGEGVGGAGG